MFHSEALQIPGTIQVLQAKNQPSQKPEDTQFWDAHIKASVHQKVSGCCSFTCRLCSNSSSTRVLTPNSWSISSSSLACGERKDDQ